MKKFYCFFIILLFYSCKYERKYLLFDKNKMRIDFLDKDLTITYLFLQRGNDTLVFSTSVPQKAKGSIELIKINPDLSKLKQLAKPDKYTRDCTLWLDCYDNDSIVYHFYHTFDFENNQIDTVESQGRI